MLLGHTDKNGVWAKPDHFDRHGYMIGTTGTGKTTTMLNLAQGMISEKWGSVIFIDPHGDASYQLLETIPDERAENVILFDPISQEKTPFGLNLFSVPDPKRMDISAQWAVTALKQAISADAQWGMTVDRVSRHLFYALAPQGGTILEIPRFLQDTAFRARFYPYLEKHHPITHNFWFNDYDAMGMKRDYKVTERQIEQAGPILRRLDLYLADSRLRNILGQARVSLNIKDIIENGKSLIVRLPEAELGEQASGLLGAIILSHLFIATLSRSSQPKHERKPVFVLIDEFQNFISHEDLPRFLTESRKYAVHLIVAHQHRSQLGQVNIKDAVLGVGSIIAFETLEKDSKEITGQMGVKDNLADLEKYECWIKLDGEKAQHIKSMPELRGNVDVMNEIVEQSAKLGTPVEQVEGEIENRNKKQYVIKEVSYDLEESNL